MREPAMAHDLLNEFAGCDPDRLKLLHRAFEELWKDIAGTYGALTAGGDAPHHADSIFEPAADVSGGRPDPCP